MYEAVTQETGIELGVNYYLGKLDKSIIKLNYVHDLGAEEEGDSMGTKKRDML